MNRNICPLPIKLITITILITASVSISCNLINYTKPKTDPSIALTQVAINVSTNLTMTAASIPKTVTPVPTLPTPTWTPIRTATPLSFVPNENNLTSPSLIQNETDMTPLLGPLVTPNLTSTPDASACIYRANLEYTDTNENDRYPLKKEFTKVWRIKNTGTCNWAINYEFFFVRGDLIGAKIAYPLTKEPIHPNGYANIKIQFKSPNKPGTYIGYWMIRGDNHVFGVGPKGNQLLWIKIEAYQKKP